MIPIMFKNEVKNLSFPKAVGLLLVPSDFTEMLYTRNPLVTLVLLF